jgi:hypothetical protein
MRQFLEKILPQSFVDSYKKYKNKHSAAGNRKQWELAGKPLPPPHTVKQEAIRFYQQKSGYHVLVETGTYKGDMILAQKENFNQVYSIELSQALFEKAKKRFHGQPGIKLLQGNSGDVIASVLAELREPAVFWLDGHYSGGITATIEKYSPVIEELETLAANNQLQHVILVDDARCFIGADGYPTIDEMKKITASNFPGYHFSVDEDIIRLIPGKFS